MEEYDGTCITSERTQEKNNNNFVDLRFASVKYVNMFRKNKKGWQFGDYTFDSLNWSYSIRFPNVTNWLNWIEFNDKKVIFWQHARTLST